jgi:hypothetical protein
MTDALLLPSILLRRIPEVAPLLREHAAAWGQDTDGTTLLPDHVFGGILAPYTASLIRSGEGTKSLITARRVFDFLEELMADENEAVRNVVEVSFCEQLAEERDILEKAQDLMGPRLRQSMNLLLS